MAAVPVGQAKGRTVWETPRKLDRRRKAMTLTEVCMIVICIILAGVLLFGTNVTGYTP
jgi:hypothetical protein